MILIETEASSCIVVPEVLGQKWQEAMRPWHQTEPAVYVNIDIDVSEHVHHRRTVGCGSQTLSGLQHDL